MIILNINPVKAKKQHRIGFPFISKLSVAILTKILNSSILYTVSNTYIISRTDVLIKPYKTHTKEKMSFTQ